MTTPLKHKRISGLAAGALLLTLATPALADIEVPIRVPSSPNITPPFVILPDTDANKDGGGLASNQLSLAVGAAVVSDYEGSSHYSLSPVAGATARWRGHAIAWRGNSLGVDLVPEYRHQTFKFVVVPFIEINRNRVGTQSQPAVALLPDRKMAVQGGAVLGVVWKGVLLSKNDSLTVQVSASHDLGAVHRSFEATPSVSYVVPLSKAALVSTSASLDAVGAGYGRYYFGIDSAASVASGLPVYRAGGGIKSVNFGLGGLVSLRGDLRKGFAVGLLLNYERLLGGFADSPLVAMVGNANQFSTVVGLTYTF